MATIQMVRINEPLSEYSDNLLTYNSTFNNDLVFSIASGSGLAQTDNEHVFQGENALKITNYLSSPMTVTTVTDLGFTAPQDGYYIFSLRLFYESSNGDDPSFLLNIFRNGVASNQYNCFYADEFTTDNWVTFYQSIYFDAGDLITYSFDFNPAFINDFIWVDGLKCELDDKNLGIPTAWTMPIDFCCGDTNKYTGWAYYVDSLATPTIVVGTTYTQITIDALGATINSYLPLEIRGVSQLWAGSKITPISVGDDYDGRFDLTITAKTGSPTAIELIIDISGSTPGTTVAFTGWLQAIGTAPYNQSMPLDFFALSTFLTNGGKIYAKTDTGTVTIGRRNIKISRKSNAF